MAHSAAKVLFTFAVLVLSEADLLEDYPAIADTYPAIADTYDRANTYFNSFYELFHSSIGSITTLTGVRPGMSWKCVLD